MILGLGDYSEIRDTITLMNPSDSLVSTLVTLQLTNSLTLLFLDHRHV